MKALYFFMFIFPLATFASADKSVYTFAAEDGKVSFSAVGHPSVIKIHGEGQGAKGELTEDPSRKITGNLEFDLTSLKTGISMRDEHMKVKYLKTEAFPTAKLKITQLTVPASDGKALNLKEIPFTGLLTLKGEERPVQGKVNLSQSGADGKVKVEANFALKLSDFKIDIPSYAGITVAEDVNLAIEANVRVANSK